MEAGRERACASSLVGIHRARGGAQLRLSPLRMGRGVLGEPGASHRPLPSPDAPGGLRDRDGSQSREEKGQRERPRQPGFPGERALPTPAGDPARAVAAARGTGQVAAAMIDHENDGGLDANAHSLGWCEGAVVPLPGVAAWPHRGISGNDRDPSAMDNRRRTLYPAPASFPRRLRHQLLRFGRLQAIPAPNSCPRQADGCTPQFRLGPP